MVLIVFFFYSNRIQCRDCRLLIYSAIVEFRLWPLRISKFPCRFSHLQLRLWESINYFLFPSPSHWFILHNFVIIILHVPMPYKIAERFLPFWGVVFLLIFLWLSTTVSRIESFLKICIYMNRLSLRLPSMNAKFFISHTLSD